MKPELKKLLVLNLPYLLFVYLFAKCGQAYRLAAGADASAKLLHLTSGISAAFANPLPSLHPFDLCVGVVGALAVRLIVYSKGKNAKKYRKGEEYGSARWGTAKDIAPYIAPKFKNNILLTKTALGRSIYCVGGNPEAARLSGINSANVLTFCYTLSGFMAALAGIVSIGRSGICNGVNAIQPYDTDAIAACIIGGASFMGGKGTMVGTMLGALIIAVLRNGFSLLSVSSAVQNLVLGLVIIGAVLLDVTRERMAAKARRLAAK